MLQTLKYKPKIAHYLTYLSHLALISFNESDKKCVLFHLQTHRMLRELILIHHFI